MLIGRDSFKKEDIIALGVIPVALAVICFCFIIPFNKLMTFPVNFGLFIIEYITLMFLHLIIHEGIHGAFFILFGQGKAHIKYKYENKAIVTHQTNKDILYTRWQMMLILIMPYILVSILFILIGYVFPSLLLISFFIVVINAGGSSIDFYICVMLLTKYKNIKHISIENVSQFRIYEKPNIMD